MAAACCRWRAAAEDAGRIAHPRSRDRSAASMRKDPARAFLPSVGVLEKLRRPDAGDGIRVDTGVREGDAVTVYYDPMIAKIIGWADKRDDAALLLSNALTQTQIAQECTAMPGFLVRTLRDPDFLAHDIDTAFIERQAARRAAAGSLLSILRRSLRARRSSWSTNVRDCTRAQIPGMRRMVSACQARRAKSSSLRLAGSAPPSRTRASSRRRFELFRRR